MSIGHMPLWVLGGWVNGRISLPQPEGSADIIAGMQGGYESECGGLRNIIDIGCLAILCVQLPM